MTVASATLPSLPPPLYLTEPSALPRVICATGASIHMPITRNVLFLIVGALIVAVAALGYKVYNDHKEPKGVQLNIGPGGISVQKK